MSYLEQLKLENTHPKALPKLTEPPFDSFDSRGRRQFSEKKAPHAVTEIEADEALRFTDTAIYQGTPTPAAIDLANEMLKYIADQQRPCAETEIVASVRGDSLMARNVLRRLAVDGIAEVLPGGMYQIPEYPPAPANLPEGCPLTGAFFPETECRFDRRLFKRLVVEGVLPLPNGRCPLGAVCKLGRTV